MLTIGALIDWVLVGILAAPLVAVLLVTGVGDVLRARRAERESAKLRHPSALAGTRTEAPAAGSDELPKAA
jgi:hypothetical protein